MSNITVRFVHRQSRTPVLELEGVEASVTVGVLRELLMERLASEESCMMRVFVKWHAQIALPGGNKRLIELTDEDAEASLGSVGISHLSEVHLDGPLTGGSDGVGQALAVLGVQMHLMDKGQSRVVVLLETIVAQNAGQAQQSSRNNALLETIAAQNAAITHQLQANNSLALLPSEAYLARQALAAEEGLSYGQLMAIERYEGYRCLLAESTIANKKLFEASAELKKLSIEARNRSIPFTIDRNTPHKTFTISDDGTTAIKTSGGWATFRASEPLTATNNKWAVKIVEDVGKPVNMTIGLLPNFPIPTGWLESKSQVDMMEGSYECVGSSALGGWGMGGNGYKLGNWQCPSFTFGKRDVVVCDFNFAANTLTLSCGDRKAVGTIPSIKEGDELYPALAMYYTGQQVALVAE